MNTTRKPAGELKHNPRNAVTGAIERIHQGESSVVRKVLNGRNTEHTAPEWQASSEPAHWNYWRREALVYNSQIHQWLAGSGVRLPRLLGSDNTDEQTIELTLEDIQGRSGFDLSIADYSMIAGAWGRAQGQLGRITNLSELAWLSRGFLPAYAMSKPVNYALLDSDEAWSQPLIAANWPPELRVKLMTLYKYRYALMRMLASAPQLLSHLDFWPNNVFIAESDELIPVDWAFFGMGSVAEDIGNFIPDSVFDGFMPAAVLADLTEDMLAAYCKGLLEGGVPSEMADPDLTRQCLWASAVKYMWLGPLLLERAGAQVQQTYGGADLEDAHQQYRARGATLDFICDWAVLALDGT